MEDEGLSLMDIWKTYVLPLRRYQLPVLIRILSGIWEDRPLVCHRLALYTLVNSLYPPALRLSKTS